MIKNKWIPYWKRGPLSYNEKVNKNGIDGTHAIFVFEKVLDSAGIFYEKYTGAVQNLLENAITCDRKI